MRPNAVLASALIRPATVLTWVCGGDDGGGGEGEGGGGEGEGGGGGGGAGQVETVPERPLLFTVGQEQTLAPPPT